jgi:acyl-CoA thioesterase-1
MSEAQRIAPDTKRRGIYWFFGLLLTGFVWPFGTAAAHPTSLHIMVLGDSITAGLGLTAEDSLPAQLKRWLLADGYNVDVINSGVSGDTTAMALARLDTTLSAGPVDLAIIELGINDMGHRISPKEVRANLEKIIMTLQVNSVAVLLMATASFDVNGQAYKQEFDSIYPDLAEKYGLILVPFILEDIWGDDALLIDALHPNAAGVTEIIRKMAPYVEKAPQLMIVKKSGKK